MNVVFEVSAAFVLAEEVAMTAEDLGYGFEHGFLKRPTSSPLPRTRWGAGPMMTSSWHWGPCCATRTAESLRFSRSLDDPERVHDPRESARKWLYLQLKAAYDERERLSDPLGT